ncbi:MAG: DNA polymerase III subunit beta [Clostridia bacterium]|nr:DNA polymerase III subunit beta [Clostridia bacterium]
MRFRVDTKELNEAISVVTKAMPAHSSMPILEGIYLYASGSSLFLKCSDLSLQIETEIAAFVEEEGGAVFTGRTFPDLVRRFNGQDVEFEGDKNTVTLKSGRSRPSLQTADIKDFPEMKRVDEEFSAEIKQSSLKNMIRQTSFAVSLEESRPILTGICLEFKDDDTLQMVALDGFRVAIRREKIKNRTGVKSVVIPSRAMQEIANVLSGDDEIKLVFSSTHVKLDFGYTKIISRLLDGDYVNYSGFMREQHTSHAIVDCRELQDAIERVSLLAKEAKSNSIKFSFTEDQLSLFANSEKGSIEDQIYIQLMGKPIDIAFNAKYILDAVKFIDDEKACLKMSTSVTPLIIEPMEGNAFYYMVLPVRMFGGA